jgi:hypothetical protein
MCGVVPQCGETTQRSNGSMYGVVPHTRASFSDGEVAAHFVSRVIMDCATIFSTASQLLTNAFAEGAARRPARLPRVIVSTRILR